MTRCPSLTALTTVLLFPLIACSSLVQAQAAFRPVFTWRHYYAYAEGRALYIGGGSPDGPSNLPLTQAFSIDLSVSWNASSPKYTALADGPAVERAPSTITPDGKQWVVCLNDGCLANVIGTKEWVSLVKVPGTSFNIIGATTDPETGLMYIPNEDTSMVIVDVAGKTYKKDTMAPALMKSNGFSVAWSASSKTMFYFGGTTGSSVSIAKFNAYSYSPTSGWKDLTTAMKGPIPGPRMGACLVSAYGGTKMILFGGYTMDRVKIYGEILIFDVATMTWTSGQVPSKKDQRGDAACAVSGDYFITWGGIGGSLTSEAVTNSTAVYNLKTNAWTTNYVAAPIPTTTSKATPSGGVSTSVPSASATPRSDQAQGSASDNSSESSNRTIIIVAAVLGVLVIVLAIWAAVLFRNYRRRREPRNPSEDTLAGRHGPQESPVKEKFSPEERSLGNSPPYESSVISHMTSAPHTPISPHTSLPPSGDIVAAIPLRTPQENHLAMFNSTFTPSPAAYPVAPGQISKSDALRDAFYDAERTPQNPHEPISNFNIMPGHKAEVA
ncbi:hypothetical protein B0O80DRAFT_434768 [Mortierella sp. GBAus27b]|nr:hypothetical protein BGX31_008127 [Mortierella sp. GBA43]KAI8361963.1 hypothetical protein B0O80DRAFT_434768 [Mortierella sp. GBAus27b]